MLKRIFSSFLALVFMLLGFFCTPVQKCKAKFNGTFIQSWLCLWWDDAVWQEEIRNMKEAGIEYLILQNVASFPAGENATPDYPSELSCFNGGERNGDVIDSALRNCRGSGIKVFVGLADFDEWWNQAGLSEQYYTVCSTMALMEEEIYGRYYEEYKDVFYGWYFTPEINNSSIMKISMPNIIEGFNTVIDKANELNPAMPMLLSPYYSEYFAVSSVLSTLPMWQLFMQGAHLRDGDIFCPQDGIGAGWVSIDNMEKVWQMYASAVKSCDKDILLWANCECMTVAQDDTPFMPPETIEKENATVTLDRFVRQMEIASRYVDNIITFSYNHYISPLSVNPVYHYTYLDYLENGKLEAEAPSAVRNVSVKDGELIWEAAEDNIGIAYYLIYDNGEPVARIEGNTELQYKATAAQKYSIVTVDGAGNKSAASESVTA